MVDEYIADILSPPVRLFEVYISDHPIFFPELLEDIPHHFSLARPSGPNDYQSIIGLLPEQTIVGEYPLVIGTLTCRQFALQYFEVVVTEVVLDPEDIIDQFFIDEECFVSFHGQSPLQPQRLELEIEEPHAQHSKPHQRIPDDVFFLVDELDDLVDVGVPGLADLLCARQPHILFIEEMPANEVAQTTAFYLGLRCSGCRRRSRRRSRRWGFRRLCTGFASHYTKI